MANSTSHDTVTSKTHEEPIQYVGFWRRSLASTIEWNLILLLALLLALPFFLLGQFSFTIFLLEAITLAPFRLLSNTSNEVFLGSVFSLCGVSLKNVQEQ